MGAYYGAEVFDLVGYILRHKLSKLYGHKDCTERTDW